MVNRKLIAFATIEVILEVSEDMTDDQALDEFYSNTSVTFDETQNVGVSSINMFDLSLENPLEDFEDQDDEFYDQKPPMSTIDDYTEEEFNALSSDKQHELIRRAMS